jgi:hypothetical protein
LAKQRNIMKQVVDLVIKKQFFDKLDERRKRQYAAIEALSLGYGGQSAVRAAFGISLSTIHKGIIELQKGTDFPDNRIRKKGGGRKKNDSSPKIG